jgi:hypothetical protein
MRAFPRLFGISAAAFGIATALLSAGPVVGQSGPENTPSRTAQPESVTTDTPEYCLHLRDLLSGQLQALRRQPSTDVIYLSREGQLMCDQGQVRAGILRLRRALVLMRADSGASP